jgi:hypothetical protein
MVKTKKTLERRQIFGPYGSISDVPVGAAAWRKGEQE